MQMTDWDVLEQTYMAAEGKGGGDFKPLPTGKYQAKIIENQFDLSKMQFQRKFQVISGEYTGRKQMDWLRLFKKDGKPNEMSADRLKSEIRLLDEGLASLPLRDSYQPFCEGSLDQIVEIYVSTKEGTRDDGAPTLNSTVYINEFLPMVNGAETPF